MYKERILDHYRNPRNFEEGGDEYYQTEVTNPSCGDTMEVFVLVEDEEIVDARFVGEGCAISMASASILSQEIQGEDIEELERYDRDKVLEILGIEITPMRLKCALLPRDAFLESVD